MPDKLTSKQLDAENQSLRARLEKTEATLSEIFSGDADALLIPVEGGAQLFTLKGADQSYRTLIENMSEGALTLTPQGLVLYANRRFADMLRTPLEKVIGSDIHDWFAPESRQILRTLLQQETIDNSHEELFLAAADGTQVPIYLSMSRLVLDESDSVCMVVTDLTEQKRNEAILAAEKLSNAILEQAADAIVICDNNGQIIRASKQAQVCCSKSPVGQAFDHAFQLRHLDGTAFSAIESINAEHSQSIEATLNVDGREYSLLVSVGHLNGAENELLGSVVTLTDITELKTTELALEKSEQQLSEALTVAKIGYWEYEYSTDEFIFNDQYYLLHKITAEEAGGYRMSVADFASHYVYPEDVPIVAKNVRLAFESRDPDFSVTDEARILSGQGEIIWVEVRFRVKQDAQGNTTHLLGINQDITARKQSEQDALDEKQFSDTMIQSLPAIFFLLDQQSNLIRWNDNLMELTGRSLAEMAAANALDFVEQEQQPLVALKIREAFETGSASIEAPMTTKDGVRLYAMNGVRIETRRGVNLICIGIDITERQEAREKLLESENILQLVVENVPARIFWKDLDLRYLGCNTRFAKDAGLSSPGELTGKNDFAMGWKEQAELYRAKDMEVLESGVSSLDIEEPQTTPDGSMIWLRTSKVPLRDKDNQIIGILGLYLDITESRQAGEHLKLFRALLDNSSDAIEVFDPVTMRILDVNETQCRQLGYSREEMLSMKLTDIDAGFTTSQIKAIRAQIQNKGDARFESMHRRKDDTTFPVEVSAKLVELDKPYLLSIVRDITERKLAELKLHESERRFSDMLKNVELVSMMLDREARITYCNDYLLRLTGWKREEIIGKNWWDIFVPPELHDLSGVFYAELLDNQPEVLHHENDIVTRSGERRLIRWNNSVLRSEDGEVIGIASIGEDITEQTKSEASIKYLNRVLSVLSGINTLIVRVNDREELFREACNIAVGKGGFRMAMLVIVDRSTMLPVSITSAGKGDELLAAVKNVMSSSEGMQKTLIARAIRDKKAVISNDTQNDSSLLFGKHYAEAGINSMTVLPLIISGEAVGTLALYASEIEFFHEDEMKLLTELASDIAFAIDHIEKQERLNYLAYYDELTGLANRSLFFDRSAQYIHSAIRGGHKLAIGLIDLERFKNINDSLGRPAGDALLKQMAAWLTQFTQDANLLARIDADHFAFVVPEVKTDGNLAKLVENLMTAFLVHPFHLNDAMFRVGIKLGIALFPDDGDDINILFRNAEAALKKAKASGDRVLFYTQKMSAAVADKLALETQLREAIDNEEFVLHYQPKVNLVSGKVTGAEALIRWNDPRTGLVPPGMFIPMLEETGLIYEVGRWALRKAIEDNLRWRVAGLAVVRIAVNVSPLQLRNTNFLNEIRQVISIDAQAAEGLELEITESLIMEDVQYSIDTLKSIRALGISFAIDDFGTGFSSLSYLAKLPVDTLKIDRAFVIEMDTPEGLALVSTIIILAHALKLKVVAEGVETEKQSRQLLSLNCDEMQGYLFSKPVPAEIFEARFMAPLTTSDKQ